MSFGEEGGTEQSGVGEPGKVVVHPAAGAAAARMVGALADEFDRWMADEIEELAQTYETASVGLTDRAHELSLLTERLIEQASLLGHPRVAIVAARLHERILTLPGDLAPHEACVARDIGELRDAATR